MKTLDIPPRTPGYHIGVVDVTIPTTFDDDMLYAPSGRASGPWAGRGTSGYTPLGDPACPPAPEGPHAPIYTCGMVASTTTTAI